MANSVVDVCNSALQKLGASRILSLNDNSREARSCVVAYDSNRRSELRKYIWSFAKKRVVLAADTTAPAFEYTYQFTLPSDCLRVLLPKDSTLDWVLEGRKILTNTLTSPYGGATSASGTASLSLVYIADIEDTTLWDSNFYDMMAISLAIDLREDITQSNTKYQILAKDYDDAKNTAYKTGALEKLPIESGDDDLWTVRL